MKNNNLHDIKSSGYKTPDDYFKSFDEKILSKLNDNNPLTAIEDTGFKVPNGYFDTIEDTIINKVSTKRNSKIIPLFNKRNLIYISSIAAAVLLLFNLSIFDNKLTFDSLDIETVENYIINENISSSEIASLLTDEELSEENFIDYNFESETVENYILNNIDIEDLFIE